ncbi:MAG TPA: hypothetical protein VHP33_14730 [Polyangiaceae bacterium]|nr:hypothetical protein [Polyangiaceae bacterium]
MLRTIRITTVTLVSCLLSVGCPEANDATRDDATAGIGGETDDSLGGAASGGNDSDLGGNDSDLGGNDSDLGGAAGMGPGVSPGGDGSGLGGTGHGGDASEGMGQRPDLLGPVNDNEAPIVLPIRSIPPYCQGGGNQTPLQVLSDASGNALVRCTYSLTSLNGRTFTQNWSVGPFEPTVHASQILPSGNVLVGGSAGGIVVAEYSSEGDEIWTSAAWSASGTSKLTGLAVASDGAIYATGNSSGQAPGNPPEVSTGQWLARYDSAGTLSWLSQYETLNGMSGIGVDYSITIDENDTIYTSTGAAIRRFDSEGNLLATDTPSDSAVPPRNLLLAPDQRSFYSLTSSYAGPMPRLTLANFSLDLNLNWFRQGEPPRTSVIDAVEGTIWTGDAVYFGTALLVTEDAVYVSGPYGNSYQNGSSPPSPTSTTLIARYDLSGERVWFQQFLLPLSWLYGARLAEDPSGNIIAAVPAAMNAVGPYVFKVRSEDGSLIE